MAMNTKGQTMMIAVVTALVIFMIGMMSINFIKDEVTRARTGLSCSSTTISDGTKLVCLTIDIVVPYFIITVFSIAGGLITVRLVLG